MSHIKFMESLKVNLVANIMHADPHSHPRVSKGHNSTFPNNVILYIKLKGTTNASIW